MGRLLRRAECNGGTAFCELHDRRPPPAGEFLLRNARYARSGIRAEMPDDPRQRRCRKLNDLPIVMEMDVAVAGLGESKWGASNGFDPSLYLTIGNGVVYH